MIKYLKRVDSLSDDKLAKKALKQQIQDDRNGHYNWVSQTEVIKNEFSVSTDDSDYCIKNKIKEKFNENLKQCIANCLNQRKSLELMHSSNLL